MAGGIGLYKGYRGHADVGDFIEIVSPNRFRNPAIASAVFKLNTDYTTWNSFNVDIGSVGLLILKKVCYFRNVWVMQYEVFLPVVSGQNGWFDGDKISRMAGKIDPFEIIEDVSLWPVVEDEYRTNITKTCIEEFRKKKKK